MSEARVKLRVRGVERSWEIPGLSIEEARDRARELILARYHVETLLDEDDDDIWDRSPITPEEEAWALEVVKEADG